MKRLSAPYTAPRAPTLVDAGGIEQQAPTRARRSRNKIIGAVSSKESLINLARKGDRQAILQLMEDCRVQIMRGASAGSYAGLVDPSDGANRARVTILAKFSTFRGVESQLCAWMRTCAFNAARMESRREGRHAGRRTSLDEARDRSIDLPSGTSRIENQLVVEELLSTISSEDREILELRYYGDLSVAEIAERLDYHPGSVRRRLRQALDRCAQQLNAAEELEAL